MSANTSISWSYPEVDTFLRLVADERIQRELEETVRNEKVFREVAAQMAAQGYQRTSQQCRQKLKKLRSDYRAIRAAHNDQGEWKRKTWKWFGHLDGIYRHRLTSHNWGEIGVDSTTTLLKVEAEPISIHDSSATDILDPPGSTTSGSFSAPTPAPAQIPASTPPSAPTPASIPALASAPTPAPTPAAASTSGTSSTTSQPAISAKRKRDSTRPDLRGVIEEMQADDERDRAQCDQHIRLLLIEAREAREQEAAIRREEIAQNASFNQAFLCVLGKLVQAISGPTRQNTTNQMQTEDERNRDQCDQHIPFSLQEAREQEAASQREEMAQNASFDQAFPGVLGKLGQATSGRHV